MVRDRAAQGHDVRVRDHRHLPGHPLAGHGLRPAAPLHGRDRRRLPRLGHPQGRHRRRVVLRSPARPRRWAPRSAPRRPSRGSSSGTAGPRASRSRTARRSRPRSSSRSADAKVTFLDLLEPGSLDPQFEQEVRRFKFRGSARARSTSPWTACRTSRACRARASTSAAPSRSARRSDRDGAGLRRREVRPLEPASRTST